MQMVGFHLFDLLICGVLLAIIAGIAVAAYLIVNANARRRNLP